MRKSRTYIVAAALVVAILAAMAFAVGCGGSDTPAADKSSPAAGALEGTAAERAATILGHEPAGKAKAVIDKGTMTVNNDPNYPPQSSVDQATGELVGFDVDVAKKIGEILALPVEFVDYKFENILTDLPQDRYDVSIGSMTINDVRKKKVDFTDPYYFAPASIVVKEGGQQITGIEDLAGKKVGVGAGTTYLTFLQENTEAIPVIYDTDAAAFPDLANGERIDFAFTATPTASEAIKAGQPFELSGDPIYYEELGIAIKQGEADWLALLNHAVQSMHADGSLTDMSLNWYDGVDLTQKAE